MKTIATLGIVIAIASGTSLAFAQSNQPPLSRAEVKAETRALEKAHKLTPAGQGVTPYQAPSGPSTRTRADRKAETMAARNSHELEPAGDTGAIDGDRLARAAKPMTTRAERKAETRAAEKAGSLTPAGEGLGAPKR